MPELDRLVLAVVLALGAVLLLPAAARDASRRCRGLGDALGRRARRLRETGPAVIGRRAAAGLLGSASALLVVVAPARAIAPDRAVAATGPQAAEPRHLPRAARAVEVTLNGSLMTWAIHREGTAADWLLADLDRVLGPSPARGPMRRRRP